MEQRSISVEAKASKEIVETSHQEQCVMIERFNAEQAKRVLPQLVVLLQDCVNSGAAVGFLPPLSTRMAEDYWGEVIRELAQGTRILLVASEENVVTGAVQLALVTRPNSLHRAEVQKLFVHTSFRQRGIAQALMKALEEAAMSEGRKLLVLDTRRGDAAEQLYLKLGYTRAGIIPRYARSADGTLHDTVVFYRVLDDEL